MKVKDAYYALAVFLSLTIIVSSIYSMPRESAPDYFIAESRERAALRGTLKASRFPVERFGPAPLS